PAAGEDEVMRPDRELVTVFADQDLMARPIALVRHRGDLASGEDRNPGLVEGVEEPGDEGIAYRPSGVRAVFVDRVPKGAAQREQMRPRFLVRMRAEEVADVIAFE